MEASAAALALRVVLLGALLLVGDAEASSRWVSGPPYESGIPSLAASASLKSSDGDLYATYTPRTTPQPVSVGSWDASDENRAKHASGLLGSPSVHNVAAPAWSANTNDDFVNGVKMPSGRDRGAAFPPRVAEDYRGKQLYGRGLGNTGPWDDHADFRLNDAALPHPSPLGYSYASYAPHSLAVPKEGEDDAEVPEPILVNPPSQVTLEHDGALQFDGVNDYAVVPPLGEDDSDMDFLKDNSFSFELWAKRDRQGVTEYFISQGVGVPALGVQFGVTSRGQLRFGFWGEGTETPPTLMCTQGALDPVSGRARACVEVPSAGGMDEGELTLSAGLEGTADWESAAVSRVVRSTPRQEATGWTAHATGRHTASDCADTEREFLEDVGSWHHYAATFDAETKIARVYRDGVLVLGERRPSSLRVSGDLKPCRKASLYRGSGSIRIGRGVDSSSSSDYFSGRMEEVRVWSGVALPRNVIATYAHYTRETILEHHPMRTHLSLYLDCNRGSRIAALAYDLSTHRRTAQLVNGPEYVAGFRTHVVEATGGDLVTGLELDLWRSTRDASASEHVPTNERVAATTQADPALYRYVLPGTKQQDPWFLLSTDSHRHRHPWLYHPADVPSHGSPAFYGLPGLSEPDVRSETM